MKQALIERSDFHYEILEGSGSGPLRCGGEMQLGGVKNANGRVYPDKLWTRVSEDRKTVERLRGRRMLGELDHPESGKTALTRASHVMTEIRLQPSTRFPGKTAVYGVYECLPTPSGKILEALLRAKVGLQVSSRGDGDLEEQGGESVVIPESYELDTFDVVIDPSVNTDVRVLESIQKEDKSCSCHLPEGKASHEIIKAIYDIVESKNYDRDCALYYKSLLESYNGNKLEESSESFLMATQSIKSINEYLEVKQTMKEPTTVTEARTSGLTEAQVTAVINENSSLKTQLEQQTKLAQAGELAVSELLVQARGQKMLADNYSKDVTRLKPLEARYESAKQVIARLQSQLEGLQTEGKLRMAAERLLGALVNKIDEAKRRSYVERLLKTESEKTKESLRPVLMKCKNRREVNESLIRIKSVVNEGSHRHRDLPPITESGRRNVRIAPKSPLMENRGAVVDGRLEENRNDDVKIGGVPLKESVAFAKSLVKKNRQAPAVPSN